MTPALVFRSPVHASSSTLSRTHAPLRRATPGQRPARAAPVAALGLATQLVTLVSLGSAAWLMSRHGNELEQQQQHTSEVKAACPTCDGSGYESCLCSRWNDADVGCGSCRKTGYMKCRSCGGDGNATPIYVPMR